MSTLAQREIILQLINQASNVGARLHTACVIVGLAARTVRRWVLRGNLPV